LRWFNNPQQESAVDVPGVVILCEWIGFAIVAISIAETVAFMI
jgi:hypothetical protein